MGGAGSFPGCEDKGCEFMRVEKKTGVKGKTVGYNGCRGHALSHITPNANALNSAVRGEVAIIAIYVLKLKLKLKLIRMIFTVRVDSVTTVPNFV